jgi:hypothetical protein
MPSVGGAGCVVQTLHPGVPTCQAGCGVRCLRGARCGCSVHCGVPEGPPSVRGASVRGALRGVRACGVCRERAPRGALPWRPLVWRPPLWRPLVCALSSCQGACGAVCVVRVLCKAPSVEAPLRGACASPAVRVQRPMVSVPTQCVVRGAHLVPARSAVRALGVVQPLHHGTVRVKRMAHRRRLCVQRTRACRRCLACARTRRARQRPEGVPPRPRPRVDLR